MATKPTSHIIKGAEFSPDRVYRYRLWRIWDTQKPLIMFIGLNPSVADEACDDRTISKLMKYAERWNVGGFYIGNLFAFITPHPRLLKEASSPVGKDNDSHLREMANQCKNVVGMWGNDGIWMDRNKTILHLFPRIYCFAKTKSGEPKHPLYLPGDIRPFFLLQNT